MKRALRLGGVVLSNLRRSRVHFLLASIGVVVGIATFTFFTALGLGVTDIVLGKIFPLDKLEVVPKSLDLDVGPLRFGVGRDVLDDDKVAELAAIPGVDAVYPKMRLTTPVMATGGAAILGSDIRSEMIMDGIEPALVAEELGPDVAFRDFDDPSDPQYAPPEACTDDASCGSGRYCGVPAGTPLPPQNALRQAEIERTQKVCRHFIPVIASHHVVELYNGALRRAHGFPKLNPKAVVGFTFDLMFGASMVVASNKNQVVVERAKLVGFSHKAITLGATMPIGYASRFNVAFGSPADAHRYHSAILSVPVKDDVAAVAQGVHAAGLDVADTGAEEAALLIAIFMAVFGLISAVIVSVAAVNIMHVFFMLVYERQHEIGIMRAVGASRFDVARIILGEATVLGTLAGSLGVSLAIGLGHLCDRISIRYIPDFPYKPETYFVFPGWLILAALGFSVGFCILGAFVPARRAARMEPARVLSGR